MTTINELIKIEEILLKVESLYKFELTLNELIKITKYLKDIGFITDLYFSTQYQYSQTICNYDIECNEKLVEYKKFLSECELDIDVSEYIDFINGIKNKVKDDNTLSLIAKIGNAD